MIFLESKPILEKLRAEIKRDVAALGRPPRLAIVMVGSNPVSKKFIELKEKFAREIGAQTRRYDFDEKISSNELRKRMKDIVHETHNDGVIVQLPLPSRIDTQSILNTVISEKDVDVLSARSVGDFNVGKAKIMPPVAEALRLLFLHYGISVEGKKVVVVGYGRLVGQPIATWLLGEKALVTVLAEEKQFDPDVVRNSDIVVSGAGRPKLITGDLVKEGAVVVDVGTSEMEGALVGDVDAASVSKKAAFLTPERGGLGPLTVALVFKNLITLYKLSHS